MEHKNKKRKLKVKLTAPSTCQKTGNGTPSGKPLDSLLEETLSNHLILKHILNFTENEDLLNLSLVNKFWCSTARSILRLNRRCLAYLNGDATFEIEPCKSLLKFNHTLMNCHEIPYSGIAFHVRSNSNSRDGKKQPPYLEDTQITEPCSYFPRSDDFNVRRSFTGRSVDEYGCQHCGSEDSISDAEFLSPEEATKIRTFYNETSHKYPRHVYLNSHLSQIFAPILERMPHHHTEIYWVAKTVCPVQSLFGKILKEKGQNLSELKITRFPHSIESNLKEYLKIANTDWLRNLKVLGWVNDNFRFGKIISAKVKAELVDAAPNLQKITGIIYLEDLKILVEKNKSHLIECLGIYCSKNSFNREPLSPRSLVKYAESKPKIKNIWIIGTLSDTNNRNENIIGVTEHLFRNLIEPVSASVQEMHLDQSHLMLRLRNCFLQPLEKLRKLYLRLQRKFDTRMGFATLEKMDWGLCFPALKVIEISMCPQENENLRVEGLQQLNTTFVCPTVTDIILVQKLVSGINYSDFWNVYDDMDFDGLAYLSRLFPNVTNFTLIRAATIDKLLNFLWISWPNVETITLRHVKTISVRRNLDDIFCGISKPECLSIPKRKHLYLDELQIVPTAPSILTLKRLKKFRIEFLNHNECDRRRNTSGKFFSQLTGRLALKRMPELKMEIAREKCDACRFPCEFTFKHLKHFVNVIDQGVGRW